MGRGVGRPWVAMLCLSGGLAPLPPAPRERAMEPRVTLRVTCRGDTRTFLVSDPVHTTWADVEAMVSAGWPREAEWGVCPPRGRSRGSRLCEVLTVLARLPGPRFSARAFQSSVPHFTGS